LLDRRDEGEKKRAFTYTEEDMRIHASDRAAAREAAVQKKKGPRGLPNIHTGAAWRVPQGSTVGVASEAEKSSSTRHI
jgi:hypothetical protein